MTIEILIGIVLGIIFFVLQHRTSKKVDKLIQQKAKTERENKAFECQRIIENLQGIQQTELGLKDFLTNYQIGSPSTDLKFYAKLSLQPITHNIKIMKDAMEQLQGKLNDASLRVEFLNYVDAFKVIPKWILEDDVPQQEHQRDGLFQYIEVQTGKIEQFIERFNKETDSSLAEKREEDESVAREEDESVAREVLDRSKYFIAPKL